MKVGQAPAEIHINICHGLVAMVQLMIPGCFMHLT